MIHRALRRLALVALAGLLLVVEGVLITGGFGLLFAGTYAAHEAHAPP